MTDTMTHCRHRNGDFINGTWVCGQCYKMLYERPTSCGAGGRGSPEQVILYQAKIAKTSRGTTLSEFLGWMTKNLRRRSFWMTSRHDALRQCLDALHDMGEPFGSDGCGWSRSDASEIVNEAIISYWDEATCGHN